MANLGQKRPQLLLENGSLSTFTFQTAEGIRPGGPLLAVSEVNAKGHPTWFDGEHSYILPGSAPEIMELRSIIQKIGSKVPLHLKNGVFKLHAWQPDTEAGFTRPGGKR